MTTTSDWDKREKQDIVTGDTWMKLFHSDYVSFETVCNLLNLHIEFLILF